MSIGIRALARNVLLATLFTGASIAVQTARADVVPPATQPAAVLSTSAAPITAMNFKLKTIHGQDTNLDDYKGKVLLIVNTASRCGFTPQYEALQTLYKTYREKGFAILAFPSNDFKQELPSDDEIVKFLTDKYHVTFPVMSSGSVVGPQQQALYRYLTAADTGGAVAGPVKWNFTKFLVGRDGRPVARFESKVKPDDQDVIAAIEKALSAPVPDATGKSAVESK